MKNKFERFKYISDHYKEILHFNEIISKRWVTHIHIQNSSEESKLSTWKMKGVDDIFFKSMLDMSLKMIKECEDELKDFVKNIDNDV